MNKKEAYQEKFDAQLREWSAKIDELKAKADQAKAEAKIEYYEQIEALRSQTGGCANEITRAVDIRRTGMGGTQTGTGTCLG